MKKNIKKVNPHKYFWLSRGIYTTLSLLLFTQSFAPFFSVAFAQEATNSASQADSSTQTTDSSHQLSDIITKELSATEAASLQFATPSSESVSPTPQPSIILPQAAGNSALLRLSTHVGNLAKRNYQAKDKIEFSVTDEGTDLHAMITDKKGNVVPVSISQQSDGVNTFFTINPPASILPGSYTLEVSDSTGVISKQNFTWGVLAINTDKATYLPDQTADIAMAVLDNNGKMVCNASITLTITNTTAGINDTLSTTNGKIKANPDCNIKNYTEKPDYEAIYDIGSAIGSYSMTLIAVTSNGTNTITDNFNVASAVDFDISRDTSTRIYPPVLYPVKINITANKDFSGDIVESVPNTFKISQLDDSTTLDYTNVTPTYVVPQTSADMSDTTGSIRLPFDGKHKITNPFGVELDPKLNNEYQQNGLIGHDGIDFDMPVGTEIKAVDAGKVIVSDENGGYGTTVVIQHSWGKSYYGHLSKLLVSTGALVKSGDVIGLSGDSGESTGPHLHFGIKLNNSDENNGYFGKIDPAPLLGITSDQTSNTSVNLSTQSKQFVVWSVSLKKGQTVALGYKYKAPDVSPQFYTIGPLSLISDKTLVYQEGRSWQIAADDVIVQGDGMLFYAATSNTNPQIRTYSETSNDFSASSGTVSNAQPAFTYIKTSPDKDEAVAGYQDTSGVMHILCYNGVSWSEDWSVTVAPSGTPTTRRFAIAYETSSGDVTVAYSRNTAATNALAYRTKSGSLDCGSGNWSGASNFPTGTSTTTGTVQWVKSVRDGRSGKDLQGWIWADSNSDLGAAVWDGTQFTNFKLLETSLEVVSAAQDIDDFELQYESLSGNLMVVWGNSAGNNGANGIRYNYCSGGSSSCTWSSSALNPNTGTGDDATNLDLAANPLTNEMAFGSIGNAGSDLQTMYWSGSAWTVNANQDTSCGTPLAGTKLVTVGWLTNNGNTKWYVSYDDSTGTGISWYYYVGAGTATKPTDFTSTPALNNTRERYDTDINPFNNAELIQTVSDSTDGIFAYKLSMDSSGNLSWSNMTSATSLGTLPSVPQKGFDFQYLRYIPLYTDAPVLYNDDGGSNQIAFNNIRLGSTTPLFRASATSPSTFNRFQIEMNTASDFTGTAYTQTLSGSYTSGTAYNLQTTGALGLPSTDGVTYYVRIRASIDGGVNYSSWSSGTWAYTYLTSASDPDWIQTTDAQFNSGTLSGLQTSGSDSVNLGYTYTAVAHDAASESHTGTTGSTSQASFSWTHTPSGTPRGVVVFVTTISATQTVTGVTYGGVSMTQVSGGAAIDNAGEPGRIDTFFLGSSVPTGAQTVTVSRTNNTTVMYASAATVTSGTSDTEIYTPGIVLLQNDQVYAAQNVDDGSTGADSVRYAAGYSGGANILAADTGSTSLNSIDLGSFTSNLAVESTPGQGIRPVGFSYGTVDDVAAVHLAIRGVATTATTGTIMSTPLDIGSLNGAIAWGHASFSTTEAHGDVKVSVYYTNTTTCDTMVPNGVLTGNSSGFDVSASPVSLTALGTGTYHEICLKATLTNSGGTPYLLDWTITSGIGLPGTPTLYNDDGGSNQIAFNNIREHSTTPIIRVSATSSSTINRYQVEFNTVFDFTGTAYTQTFSGSYTSNTAYNLQTTGTLGLPTTDGVTYYVRVRASSNAGVDYGPWVGRTWTYTYKSAATAPEWFQTSDAQFNSDTLSNAVTSGSGSTQLGMSNNDSTIGLTNSWTNAYHAASYPGASAASFAVSSDVNRILVVAILSSATTAVAQTMTSIKYGGVTMTQAVGNASTAQQAHAYLYYLTDNAVMDGTSKTLAVSMSGGTSRFNDIYWAVYNNVDASSPISDSQVINNTTAASNATFSTALIIKANEQAIKAINCTRVGNATARTISNYSTNWSNAGGEQTWGATDSGRNAIGVRTFPVSDTSDTAATTFSAACVNSQVGISLNPTKSLTSPGSITSPEIDYSSVLGVTTWGNISFSTTETYGDVKVSVYYSYQSTCDTLIPDKALPGNSAGFDVSASPINLSGLKVSEYGSICLVGTLSSSDLTPYLLDWNMSWGNGTGTTEAPNMTQMMRHGKWFDLSHTKQPFTF